MKFFAALPLLTMLYNPPQEYPVRFHMAHVHYAGRNNSSHGEGQANVSEPGQPTRGYEFTFDNCLPFREGFPGELHGRWTSSNHFDLTLLRTDLDSSSEECILRGWQQDFRYVHQNGKLMGAPLQPPRPEAAPAPPPDGAPPAAPPPQ